MSSGYYLDNFLSKQTISGSCGYAAIFVPKNSRQQSKICIDLEHKQKTEDRCKSKIVDRSFMISFGLFPFSVQECYLDKNFTLNLAVEAAGKDLEENKDQCDLSTKDKEWECGSPRTMAYFPKAMDYSNTNLKAEVKFVQISESVLKFYSMLKDYLQQYSPSTNRSQDTLLDVIKSKFSVVFDVEKNSYSLSIDSPSSNFALNSIPSGINPDLISFLNNVINQYVMTKDSKLD